MSAPALSGAVVGLSALRDRSRRELAACIDRVKGPKALVLDPSLSGPLGLIAEKQLLKDHGVEKTYHLRLEPIETDQRCIVFLVRDRVTAMKAVARQVRHRAGRGQKLEDRVVVVPRRTIVCERVLEEEGVYSDVTLDELDLDLIPCEEDVVSMELPDSFRDCLLHGDKSSLFYVARALARLQGTLGVIPTIKGKGNAAREVADMLLRMRREGLPGGQEEAGESKEPEIDELILIDREVDMVTPMLTQLTYEGLMDDTFGISNGIVELPAHLVSSQAAVQPRGKVKVQFNGSDQLFAQLRDANFEQVGAIVKKRATLLKSVEDEKEHLQGKSVGEIKEYVKRLKEINIQQEKNLLSLHTSIALEIKALVTASAFSRRLELEQGVIQGRISPDKAVDFAQDQMYAGEPLLKVLRLLVLASLVGNGLRKMDTVRQELVQIYGFQVVLLLVHLEKLGLLRKAEGGGGFAAAAGISAGSISLAAASLTNKITNASGWEAVRARLNIIVEGSEEIADDVASTYSGCAS